MTPFEMCKYDYDFLTDQWEGPKGAAYNVVYEDCREAGLCDRMGVITEAGKAAVANYVSKPYQLALRM